MAGEYDTKVELLDSSCDGIEVADNETTVEQDGDSVTLTHAGISYVGPLRDDGSFATAAVEVTVGARHPRAGGHRDLRRRRLRGPWWPRDGDSGGQTCDYHGARWAGYACDR